MNNNGGERKKSLLLSLKQKPMKPNINKFSCTEVSPFWGDLEGYFNGKEKDDEIYGEGKSLSFEFRNYDARIGRWWGIDLLTGKYPGISPYAFVADNPIMLVDPDGREIVLYELVKYNKKGTGYLARQGQVSKVTEAALLDMLKTEEGKAYLSQYAKAGDKIGTYVFAEDGKLSDRTLEIRDISLSEESGQIVPSGKAGNIKTVEENGKITTTVRIWSQRMDKYQAGETLSYEMLLHGYDTALDKEGAAKKDHTALKEKNTKHKGYVRYNNIRNQLKKIDLKYEDAFKKAEKTAEEIY